MFHVEPEIRNVLCKGLSQFNVDLTDFQIDNILKYFQLLTDKNKIINLISSKQDLETQIVVHLLDSLSLLIWPNFKANVSALDFGSGGGLPAIPLSIARPRWKYCLTEATGKKVSFLAEVKDALNLGNVTLLNRYLDYNINPEKVFYDLITARGVGSLDKLLPIAAPRLKGDGMFVAYKGPQAGHELETSKHMLNKCNLRLVDRLDLKLPLLEAERSLLFFSFI